MCVHPVSEAMMDGLNVRVYAFQRATH